MLMPKRVKRRKVQKGRMRGVSRRGCNVSFGDYGLQATTCGRITSRQIEAARVAMTRHAKRGGKIWIRIFPDKPISKKPLETRMGKGKADVDYWAARVRAGTIMFEISGVPADLAREAMARVARKMPIRCRFVGKRLSV